MERALLFGLTGGWIDGLFSGLYDYIYTGDGWIVFFESDFLCLLNEGFSFEVRLGISINRIIFPTWLETTENKETNIHDISFTH